MFAKIILFTILANLYIIEKLALNNDALDSLLRIESLLYIRILLYRTSYLNIFINMPLEGTMHFWKQ